MIKLTDYMQHEGSVRPDGCGAVCCHVHATALPGSTKPAAAQSAGLNTAEPDAP